jgi:hypothetical protein
LKSFFEEQSLTYLKSPNTRVIGVCTGLLAASAIVSCESLTSLLPLAVELVRVAYRVGSLVAAKINTLEVQTESQNSWATVVLGLSVDAAQNSLDQFNQNEVRSL